MELELICFVLEPEYMCLAYLTINCVKEKRRASSSSSLISSHCSREPGSQQKGTIWNKILFPQNNSPLFFFFA